MQRFCVEVSGAKKIRAEPARDSAHCAPRQVGRAPVCAGVNLENAIKMTRHIDNDARPDDLPGQRSPSRSRNQGSPCSRAKRRVCECPPRSSAARPPAASRDRPMRPSHKASASSRRHAASPPSSARAAENRGVLRVNWRSRTHGAHSVDTLLEAGTDRNSFDSRASPSHPDRIVTHWISEILTGLLSFQLLVTAIAKRRLSRASSGPGDGLLPACKSLKKLCSCNWYAFSNRSGKFSK